MTDSLFLDEDLNNGFDPNKNYLEELVGDGKKFKSPEELARGKAESDDYISHLLKEHDALKQDYAKALSDAKAKANFEDMLTRYENIRNNDTGSFNQADPEDDEKPSLDLKQIETLVSNKIAETAKQQEQEKNFKAVQNKLKEQLGSNYSAVLKQRIDNTPGLTIEMVDQLARTSPDAVFNLLGMNQKSDSPITAPHSSLRSDNFSPSSQTKRTRSYYVKMRKENPTQYYNPKTSLQMYEDAKNIPDFFDTEE